MEIILKKAPSAFDSKEFIASALHPEGLKTKPNQIISVEQAVGRRDQLTELQQKIVTAVISRMQSARDEKSVRTVYSMPFSDFLKIVSSNPDRMYAYLVSELEKISGKGIWLYEKNSQKLSRTHWFQAIEYTEKEITFQFTDKILQLLSTMATDDIECQLIRGIQYRGKHTSAVFDLIWSSQASGITEYSIPELMKQLSLENTRYSYGQLKLRVLEPSLQEIYDWDRSIFVRFGPTFSGRRVEGIWFEVITGEEAEKLRENEPEFKFAPPEYKPHLDK